MSYTPEFRAEAVRLYRLGDRGLKSTARESQAFGRKCGICRTYEGILSWSSKKMMKSAITEAQE